MQIERTQCKRTPKITIDSIACIRHFRKKQRDRRCAIRAKPRRLARMHLDSGTCHVDEERNRRAAVASPLEIQVGAHWSRTYDPPTRCPNPRFQTSPPRRKIPLGLRSLEVIRKRLRSSEISVATDASECIRGWCRKELVLSPRLLLSPIRPSQ